MDSMLSEDEAAAYVGGICFKTGPPRRVGVELEWLVRDRTAPSRAVPHDRLGRAIAPLWSRGLPGGSRLTREPGGQLEVSSPPGDTLAECVATTAADLEELRGHVARSGALLYGRGLDPSLTPPRVLEHPRYRAMEAHFDRSGPWGRMMMRATAAVQVSLDAGDESEGPAGYLYRWRLAHRLGPVLVAAFANSPLWRSRPTGWLSTRQSVWAQTDPGRTRPLESDGDPRERWARYALDAELLCLRRDPPADWTAPPRLSFRSWLRGAAAAAERAPTRDDLDYHLSTLFPPVRPRGWLELRMIDAQNGDGWIAATAITATLLDDPSTAESAWAATEPLEGSADVWERAARLGPADPLIGQAVRECVAAAESALSKSDPGGTLHRSVTDFAERYAERGRCPANDQLDALAG
jgi:ergothioneine biosynthesis glutamate--cysteine ligase EgtA